MIISLLSYYYTNSRPPSLLRNENPSLLFEFDTKPHITNTSISIRYLNLSPEGWPTAKPLFLNVRSYFADFLFLTLVVIHLDPLLF